MITASNSSTFASLAARSPGADDPDLGTRLLQTVEGVPELELLVLVLDEDGDSLSLESQSNTSSQQITGSSSHPRCAAPARIEHEGKSSAASTARTSRRHKFSLRDGGAAHTGHLRANRPCVCSGRSLTGPRTHTCRRPHRHTGASA